MWFAVAYHCATTLLDRTAWAVEYGVVPHAFGVGPVPVDFARRAWAHARDLYAQFARIRMCATTWGGALLSHRSWVDPAYGHAPHAFGVESTFADLARLARRHVPTSLVSTRGRGLLQGTAKCDCVAAVA